MDMHDSIENC